MAAKKKSPPKPAFEETDDFRSPRALAPLVSTGDPAIDAALAELRATGAVSPLLAGAGALCVRELSPEALDLGEPPNLGHGGVARPRPDLDVSTPAAKRAYTRFFDTVYTNQRKRLPYVVTLMRILACAPEGEARLAEVAADRRIQKAARSLAAFTLVGFELADGAWLPSRTRPRAIYEEIAAVDDLPGPAILARMRLAPDDWFMSIAPRLATVPDDAPAIIATLAHPGMHAGNWTTSAALSDAIAMILPTHGSLPGILDIAAKLPPTPALTEAAIAHAHAHFTLYPDARIDGALLTLLIRTRDPRAAPDLTRAISLDVKTSTEALDALAFHDIASTGPLLAKRLAPHEKSLAKYAPALLERAREVIAHLERPR